MYMPFLFQICVEKNLCGENLCGQKMTNMRSVHCKLMLHWCHSRSVKLDERIKKIEYQMTLCPGYSRTNEVLSFAARVPFYRKGHELLQVITFQS